MYSRYRYSNDTDEIKVPFNLPNSKSLPSRIVLYIVLKCAFMM